MIVKAVPFTIHPLSVGNVVPTLNRVAKVHNQGIQSVPTNSMLLAGRHVGRHVQCLIKCDMVTNLVIIAEALEGDWENWGGLVYRQPLVGFDFGSAAKQS